MGEEIEQDENKVDDGAKSDGDLGDAGKRALDAERKARKAAEKRAADAEAKVKASEDADKTEVERLHGQVADLTKRAEAAEGRADRYEVGLSKGLTLTQARRLVGATKDEFEADAIEMRSELGLDKEPQADGTKQRPKEDLKSGASNEDDEKVDAAKVADGILSSGW